VIANRSGVLTVLGLLLASMLLISSVVWGQTPVASVPVGPQPALTGPAQMVVNPANHKVYVVGDAGTIGVIDATTSTTLSHIANTNGGTYGILLNPTANQIYLLGGNIQVVDSSTDQIVRTFTPGPIPGAITDPAVLRFSPNQYTAGGYNPVTNILYIIETYLVSAGINMADARRLLAIDGTTGAELAVLATSGDPTLPFLGVQLVIQRPIRSTPLFPAV
jgi:DNA-binding beta-propeller fold protein YncE